ncbi:MAG: hypothetical protein IJA06_03760 [Oscillospiraceae bacterium]|nr:hypothetical protein [Oscillospiraceae bacterium]MBQ3560916.1 hypothetical protein [Oscillospiraceae bacterium]
MKKAKKHIHAHKAKKDCGEKPPQTIKATSKKKTGTSKKLAYWAGTLATGSVLTSYTLAFLELDPVSDMTTSIFTGCIGYLITYAAKSLGEKISRNRHHLDEDGNPLEYTINQTDNNEEAQG